MIPVPAGLWSVVRVKPDLGNIDSPGLATRRSENRTSEERAHKGHPYRNDFVNLHRYSGSGN